MSAWADSPLFRFLDDIRMQKDEWSRPVSAVSLPPSALIARPVLNGADCRSPAISAFCSALPAVYSGSLRRLVLKYAMAAAYGSVCCSLIRTVISLRRTNRAAFPACSCLTTAVDSGIFTDGWGVAGCDGTGTRGRPRPLWGLVSGEAAKMTRIVIATLQTKLLYRNA